jgi:hypothetical protein
MGYETKLIIGEVSNFVLPRDPGKYIKVIATIDLCVACFGGTQIDQQDNQKVFFYEKERKVRKDEHDDQLYAVDPKKVLKILTAENRIIKYRRYTAAIQLLKNIIRDFPGEHIQCVLFGH